jgi:uncharacterized protein with NRDE domain
MIYAGRDLVQGGTWLACSNNGSFATITNFHCDQDKGREFPRSRGEIVSKFVAGRKVKDGKHAKTFPWSAKDFVDEYLKERLDDFAGFSVLLFDGTTLMCCTNRGHIDPAASGDDNAWYRELPAGLYALSNHLLDTPWPKVVQAIRVMARAREIAAKLDIDTVSGLLSDAVLEYLLQTFEDTTIYEQDLRSPPLKGIEIPIQCSMCVRIEGAGTRTTTVISYDPSVGFDFVEKYHDTPFDEASTSRKIIPVDSNDTHAPTGRQMRRANDWRKSIVIPPDHNILTSSS